MGRITSLQQQLRNLTLELRRPVRPPAFVMDRGHPPTRGGTRKHAPNSTQWPAAKTALRVAIPLYQSPESRPLRPCTGASWKRDMPILLPFRGRQEPLARYGLGSRDRQVKPPAARPPELLAGNHSASPTRSCSTSLMLSHHCLSQYQSMNARKTSLPWHEVGRFTKSNPATPIGGCDPQRGGWRWRSEG